MQQSIIINKILFLLTLTSSLITNSANAQWWNPLGPKTYEDCLLQNMKEGMSDLSAKLVINACQNKFKTEEEKKEEIKWQNEQQQLAERYKKCGLDKYATKRPMFTNESTNPIINKLTQIKYDTKSNSISFQNSNNFGISAVALGFIKGKACPKKLDDYTFSTFCSRIDSTQGVSPSTYGTLACGTIPKEALSLGYCIFGFSPTYNKFDDSLLEFYEKNDFCRAQK